jgi:hypothetical protein
MAEEVQFEQAEAVVAFIYDVTPFAELSEIGRLEWCRRVEYVLSAESNEQFGKWTQEGLAGLLGISRRSLRDRLAWSRGFSYRSARPKRGEPATALGIIGKMQRLALKLAVRLAAGEKADEGAIETTLVATQGTIEILQGIEAAIESRDLDGELAKVIELAERRTA